MPGARGAHGVGDPATPRQRRAVPGALLPGQVRRWSFPRKMIDIHGETHIEL